MAQPDPNRIIRLLPIVVGALGECLFFVNRLFTPELLNSQSRSDALGVIVCAVLILVGLLWRQLQPTAPEAVKLIGESGFELDPDLPETIKIELAWASHILLTNTVTRSLAVYYQGKTILRRGVLGTESQVKPGAIIERVLTQQKPVYLVALKLYPGKVEFNYLPENTQGVICQPIGTEGVLVLGANAPRSYTRQDEAWVDAIANKLDNTLSTTSPTLKVSG